MSVHLYGSTYVHASVQRTGKKMVSANKTKRLELRVSAAMLKRINKEAKLERQTASEFVRLIVEGHFLKLDSERSYDPNRED